MKIEYTSNQGLIEKSRYCTRLIDMSLVLLRKELDENVVSINGVETRISDIRKALDAIETNMREAEK